MGTLSRGIFIIIASKFKFKGYFRNHLVQATQYNALIQLPSCWSDKRPAFGKCITYNSRTL